ncbi:hypothetical protein [uncultured Ruminococcus sp.]|uniref:hypothetical protein n=1 Tax=uncultured Ruminococcus sp. TaxID=165186 RepID=UPI00204829E7|nr:hypothetical protein [uncultured Ruminococcus sp.]DAL79706.1 MAG TPA: hypothetical protein [Caudoviricetes sp.]
MIVMREVFKRDKPLDNGSGAVSLCVFHSNVKSDECGALTVKPTKDYCRRCAFYKTREDFDRGLGNAARSLREKGLKPVQKMNYDGKQYMSVQPVRGDRDDTDDDKRGV